MKRAAPPIASATALLALALARPAGAAVDDGTRHDLARAAVADRVILAVMEYYYQPDRIDPAGMFEAAMDAVQKSVAEVKVSYDREAGTATVEVVGESLGIDAGRIRSPWALSRALHEAFAFLQEHLPRGEIDLRDLEYRAVNGMLATLDPHSGALPPDLYEDLRMGTQGEFGGLGIKITTDMRPPCNGDLTVVETFDDTPADRAGLRPGDKILSIDGDSTVNITTVEAAERLRGRPGTAVTIEVEREGEGARTVEITRRRIPIESVKWKLLEGDVGYVSLEAFQGNSIVEIRGALRALHSRGMKGLVLDLRGNPGGLLDAAIQVADVFLSSGTIVATAGRRGEEQSVSNASWEGTEPAYPIAVLVDAQSASAAEIIAAAMRNHGRALLVGETTFGKGSVQMVLPLPGDGALRLTSAQYLTPGNISIQTVGVAPDVRFRPVTVDRKDLDLDPEGRRFSEADLEGHLERPTAWDRTDRPGALESEINVPPAERRADREMWERCYTEDPDRLAFKSRFEEEFARRLIAEASGVTAEEILESARNIVAEISGKEETAVRRALARLGVDWSPPPEGAAAPGEPDGAVRARVRIAGRVAPGEKIRIEVTVVNGSDRTVYRLRGVTKSDNPLLSGHEVVFGKLAPGRKKTWSARVELPAVLVPRRDPVEVAFSSEAGPRPEPVSIEVTTPDVPSPKLSYAWHVEDAGDGNGFAEAGEDLAVHVRLVNIGDAPTFDARADLSAMPGVNVVRGRFDVGVLRPGRSVDGTFRLRIQSRNSRKAAEVKLSVSDLVPSRYPVTRTLLERDMEVPLHPPRPGPTSATGTRTVTGEGPAEIRESPDPAARVVATAEPGQSFEVVARVRDWFRVRLGRGRRAWLEAGRSRAGGEGGGDLSLAMVRPPEIRLVGDSVRSARGPREIVKGSVEHPEGIRDVMVFSGEHKIAYIQGEDGAGRIDFSVEIPLEPGANHLVVVARHDADVVATETLFVRRTEGERPE